VWVESVRHPYVLQPHLPTKCTGQSLKQNSEKLTGISSELLVLDALVVKDLVQGMNDFYQIGLIGHDLIDVFVGRRDLINQ
jgi:hypothetical protein